QAWGLWGLRSLSGEIGFDGPHITFLQTPPPQNQIGLILDTFRHRRWLLVSPWQTTLDTFIAYGIAPQRVVKVNPAIRSASNDASLVKNFRRNLGLEPRNGPVVLLGGWPEKNLRHDHGIWALGIVAKIQPQIWGIIRTSRTQCGQRANSLTGYGYFRSTLEDPGLIAMTTPEFSWRQLLMISDLFVFTPDQAVGMNSLLEAMAMGKPIVSTATSQVREVLQDDRNALLAPAGNPKEIAGRMNTLLIDSQLIERLGNEAKKAFSTLYKPEILIEQMQSIYAQTSQDPYLREPVVLSEELNNYIGNAD
ncbi:MAG TPA: glycosyltransferase family 4 protein, partial [Phycisphaerae bacterium]|nr:glycosyltransferase family 4 protein [Phycisphaerae bacterium]